MCQKQKGKMYDPEAPTFKILHAIGAVCNNSKSSLLRRTPPLSRRAGWRLQHVDVTCSSDARDWPGQGSAAHQDARVQGR